MIRKTGKILLAVMTAAAMLFAAACGTVEEAVDAAAEKMPGLAEAGGELLAGLQESGKEKAEGLAESAQQILEQAKGVNGLDLGVDVTDVDSDGQWIADQIQRMTENPGQYNEDFWNSLFGTGGNGISAEGDTGKKGAVEFVMPLPGPVSMPETYSISYLRLDKGEEVSTTLARDAAGNIYFSDGDSEQVFVRGEDGYRMFPYSAETGSFGEWDGIVLSARSVREKTSPFWNCADQTFIKWLGTDFVESTEFLDRPCGLYHAEPGTLTFTYKCDLILDDETGICLCYAADELLKGAKFSSTEETPVVIDIGDYDIGGDEMAFSCVRFETENISFPLPAA